MERIKRQHSQNRKLYKAHLKLIDKRWSSMELISGPGRHAHQPWHTYVFGACLGFSIPNMQRQHRCKTNTNTGLAEIAIPNRKYSQECPNSLSQTEIRGERGSTPTKNKKENSRNYRSKWSTRMSTYLHMHRVNKNIWLRCYMSTGDCIGLDLMIGPSVFPSSPPEKHL